MVRPVKEGITVTIKGRLFELVWDDYYLTFAPCDKCVLKDEICKTSRGLNLMALCAGIVKEPNTYFIEKEVHP